MAGNKQNKMAVALGAAVLGICSACYGQIIYVDAAAAGTGDGSSWPNACKYLQDALTTAAGAPKPVEIRVAQGIYKPDQGAGIMPGDINGDCKVDAIDQAILLSHWLMEGTAFVNTPPTIKLIAPEDGAELHYPTPVAIRAEATDADGTIILVGFHMQYGHESRTDTINTYDGDGSDGWEYELDWRNWPGPDSATCTIWAEAMDDDGAAATSAEIKVTCRKEY